MPSKRTAKPLLVVAATVATAAVTAVGIGGYVWHEQRRPPILEIYIFALQSGRSIFIRTPDDRRVLVDGGGNSEVIRHLTEILPFYSRRIDMIMSTNIDPKNVTGLIDIAERYTVGRAYLPRYTLKDSGVSTTTQGIDDRVYQVLLETLERRDVVMSEVSAGDEVQLGREVAARVLFPVPSESFSYSRASAPEVLLNITHGETSFLVMGDASKKVQNFIASSQSVGFVTVDGHDIGDTDVLVISHGATAASLSLEFMNFVRPTDVIYEKSLARAATTRAVSPKSVADPLAAIISEHRYNIKEKGTLRITSDGKKVHIEKFS